MTSWGALSILIARVRSCSLRTGYSIKNKIWSEREGRFFQNDNARGEAQITRNEYEP